MKPILRALTDRIKPTFDKVTTRAKQIEEALYADATLLPGFPRLLQLDRYTCGVQCAAMILRYYRKALPLRKLERSLGTTKDGTTATALKKLFLQRGLIVTTDSRSYPKRLRQAVDGGAPVLVSLDGDHWAVVYGYYKANIFVADPAFNRAVLVRHSEDRFRGRWDHYAMIVRDPRRSRYVDKRISPTKCKRTMAHTNRKRIIK